MVIPPHLQYKAIQYKWDGMDAGEATHFIGRKKVYHNQRVAL